MKSSKKSESAPSPSTKFTASSGQSFSSYPFVIVEWLDAAHIGGTGWNTVQTAELPLLRGAASGFLIPIEKNKFGEECVVLASAVVFEEDGPPNFCLSFVIPKGMVISVKEVV